MQKFILSFFVLCCTIAMAFAQQTIQCGTTPRLHSVSSYTELAGGGYDFTEQLSWTATSPINTYRLVVRDSTPTSTQPIVTTATVQGAAKYNIGTRPFNSVRTVTIAAFQSVNEVCAEQGKTVSKIANAGIITVVVDRVAPNNNGTCKDGYTYAGNSAALIAQMDAALLKYRNSTNPYGKVYLTLNGVNYKNDSFAAYDANKATQTSGFGYPACVKITIKVVY
jgi:hypothetical protein